MYWDDAKKKMEKDRGSRIRSALWFAGHGKANSIVRKETGESIPEDDISRLLRLLTYNTMENVIGFGTGRFVKERGEIIFFGPPVRTNEFMLGHWIKDLLALPFTTREMGRHLRNASLCLERGVDLAWWSTFKSHNRVADHGEVIRASEYLSQGVASVYTGVLKASVNHLKANGESGVQQLELGLNRSKLGGSFSQFVVQNRQTLMANPRLADNFEAGPGSITQAAVMKSPEGKAVSLQCDLTLFLLRCAHPKRSYILDVLNSRPTRDGRYLFQVVSERGKYDEVTIDFAGTCVQGKADCAAVQVNNDTPVKRSPRKFKVSYRTPQVDGFTDFVKRFLAPDLNALAPLEYAAHTQCCTRGSHDAIVQAFPPFKWQGKLEFGYDPKRGGNFTDRWYLEGNLGWDIGDSTWKYKRGDRKEDYFPQLGSAVGDIVNRIDGLITEARATAQTYKVKMNWPKVSLGGEVELLEAKNNYNADLGGKIFLKLDPLIGAEARVDILQYLINKGAPGLSGFLEEIRDKAAKGFGNETTWVKAKLTLNLFIEGKVAAELSWKKEPNQKWLSTEGNKEAARSLSLTMKLEAKLEVETKLLIVYIRAGVEVSIAGAEKKEEGVGIVMALRATTDKDKPAVGGEFIFTGMTIYYAVYFEVSTRENPNKKGGHSKFEKESGEDVGSERTFTRKEEGAYRIMEARTWPKWEQGQNKRKGVGFDKLDI